MAHRTVLGFLLLMIVVPASAQDTEAAEARFEENLKAREEWLRKIYSGDQPVPRDARLKEFQRMQSAPEMKRAQRLTPNVFIPTDLIWKPIGPAPIKDGPWTDATGRIVAVAVDPRNKDVVYIGAATGGIWKTTDGGLTWNPLTDNQATLTTGALALDPSNPDVIYVGTGEPNSGAGAVMISGAGVLRSLDAGQTWSLLGTNQLNPMHAVNENFPAIGGITVSPDGTQVLAGVKSTQSGVYRSIDKGQTWTLVLQNIEPSAVVYATNTIAYAAGPESWGNISTPGIYKSTNGGVSWTKINGAGAAGIDGTKIGRVELAVSKQDPNVVYAAINNSTDLAHLLGLYKTTDGGATWTKLPVSDFCNPQCWYDMAVEVSPVAHNTIIVGGSRSQDSVQKSTDGGFTWTIINAGVHPDLHAFGFSSDGQRVYMGGDGGMYSTENLAATTTWKNLNGGGLQTTQIYPHIGVHPSDLRFTWIGTQDNGSNRYVGTDAWESSPACGDGSSAVVSATEPNKAYLNCIFDNNTYIFPFGDARRLTTFDSRITDVRPFLATMVGDPTDGEVLYFGASRLWQSRDGAKTWRPITTHFRFNPADPNTGEVPVVTIAIAPSDPNIVYVASERGHIRRLTNALTVADGQIANAVDISAGLPLPHYLSSIAIDRNDPMHVFVAFSGFGNGGLVYKSVDGGAHWTAAATGLPAVPIMAVLVDPDIPTTVYAGTDLGVFVSSNDGASWMRLGTGMPNALVTDLSFISPQRVLRASTYGRGLWDLSIPVTYTGPALEITPPSYSFGKRFSLPVSTRRSAQPISVRNIGTEPLAIHGVQASGAAFFGNARCPALLPVGESCAVDVFFSPADVGFFGGRVKVLSNAVNHADSVFLTGEVALGVANDLIENATPITQSVFHDVVNTVDATRSDTDPVPQNVPQFFCPAGVPNKSIWYRFMAQVSGNVHVDTVNTLGLTTIAAYAGMPGNLIMKGCSFPSAPLDFAAVAGTQYYLMVMDASNAGSNVNFNFQAPMRLDLSPSILTLGVTGTGQITAKNVSGGLLTIAGTELSAPFTLDTDCAGPIPANASCTLQISLVGADAGAYAGTVSLVGAGTNERYTVTVRGTTSGVINSRPTRSSRLEPAPPN